MARYPSNWSDIAAKAKADAMWRCEACGTSHGAENSRNLSVHHIDRNTNNNEWWNLAVLCFKPCHRQLHKKENMVGFLRLAGESWFKPHLAGALAYIITGQTVSRQEALENLDLYVLALLSSQSDVLLYTLDKLNSNGRRDCTIQRMREVTENIATLVLEAGAF